jgi:hypothetical protein
MHRQSIACVSLCAAILSATLVASDGFAPPSACPAPTVPQGGQCVMNDDAVISYGPSLVPAGSMSRKHTLVSAV